MHGLIALIVGLLIDIGKVGCKLISYISVRLAAFNYNTLVDVTPEHFIPWLPEFSWSLISEMFIQLVIMFTLILEV